MSDGINFPPVVDDFVRDSANSRLAKIEEKTEADGITIISPIVFGLEQLVRTVVEGRKDKRECLLVILDTAGGIVEVIERIVRVFRRHYQEVRFLIPDRAMSAGTVLALSGDEILMDYHSCLGPVDPQLERGEGRLVPALSYLVKYEEMVAKANRGELSTADVILLEKLDLAELHQFELARQLSIDLIKEWLPKYKFKDWNETETRKLPVDGPFREARANEIAEALNNHERWGSHGRGISMDILRKEIKLKITDFGADPEFRDLIWNYFWFLRDHMRRIGLTSFVHSSNYFFPS